MRPLIRCRAVAVAASSGRLRRSEYFSIKSIAKKVSPRKKAPPPAPEPQTSPCSDITADRGSPIAEVSVEDIKALADHVDAALLPSTASRKLPEWVAKLQDAVALNCCKRRRVGERDASQ